jgi:quercetin dioxygenase-like cupin family protein
VSWSSGLAMIAARWPRADAFAAATLSHSTGLVMMRRSSVTGRVNVKERAKGLRLDIAEFEVAMEGQDMRAVVLTLAAGQCVPWHYHSDITDSFICLEGPMLIETRAPRAMHVLHPGQRCVVPPKTAHYVHGKDDGPCKFMILQGVGEYDNVSVGGT